MGYFGNPTLGQIWTNPALGCFNPAGWVKSLTQLVGLFYLTPLLIKMTTLLVKNKPEIGLLIIIIIIKSQRITKSNSNNSKGEDLLIKNIQMQDIKAYIIHIAKKHDIFSCSMNNKTAYKI